MGPPKTLFPGIQLRPEIFYLREKLLFYPGFFLGF
jgi:hypothetical protein